MARPNKYWPLIQARRAERKAPLRTIVDEASWDLFPEDVRAEYPPEKVRTMALNALGHRVRTYNIKPVGVGKDSRGNPADLFFIWQIKLTFARSYFSDEEYTSLEVLRDHYEREMRHEELAQRDSKEMGASCVADKKIIHQQRNQNSALFFPRVQGSRFSKIMLLACLWLGSGFLGYFISHNVSEQRDHKQAKDVLVEQAVIAVMAEVARKEDAKEDVPYVPLLLASIPTN